MTMRLDIVTNDAGEGVRREHARELGAGVVIAIYRLAKLAQMHDLTNQAFTRQLEQTHQIIGDYCLRSGSNVNVMFAHKAVFVAGQLLKGSRSAYEAATELGELFERLGGSELSIQRDVTREELLAFAEQISIGYRAGAGSFRSPTPKIRLRAVADCARLRGLELENLSADQRIVRMYASAVVIMRRFFEDLQASRYILPRRIKRIAQSLVDLSEGSTPAFLGVTEVRNANFDEAGRAVNTAILAVSMAREVTQDRAILSQIAMAGMMHDVARPRAMALSQAAGPAMPGMAGTDDALRRSGRSSRRRRCRGAHRARSRQRAVDHAHRAHVRGALAAAPDSGSVRSTGERERRRCTRSSSRSRVATTTSSRPSPAFSLPTPDYAVAALSEELKDPQDRTVLRMLVSALGLLPMGTVVQLATGEVAEVIRGPKGPGEKPRVRLVMDQNGQQLQPVEIELAQDPHRQVVRVMSVDGWRKGLDLRPGGDSDPREAYGDERDSQPPPDLEPAPPPAAGLRGAGRTTTTAAPLPPISPLAPVAMPPPGGTAHAQQTSRSIADQYADQYAGWSGDEAAAESDPARHDSSSSIQSGEHNSSASLPSMGSSPSAVAEAMGRMINDSLAPPAPVGHGPDRTLFQQHGEEHADRNTSRPGQGRASREPTARGNLAATPLPHVLVYMLDHSLTGSVVFEGGEGEDTIYFVGGVPTKIRLNDQVALLGQILVHGGAIETKAVEQAVEGARRLGILLGEYLVGHDLVSREALLWALEAQLLNKIAYLANLAPEITYSYFREVDLLEGWGGGDVPVGCPLNPILASVRNWMDRARVRATLNRIGKHPLVLHDDSALTSLALLPEEEATLDMIRSEGLPLAQLFKRNVAEEEVVSSLVYSLAVTRQFAFKGQKKGPMAAKNGQQWKAAVDGLGRPRGLGARFPSWTSFAVDPRSGRHVGEPLRRLPRRVASLNRRPRLRARAAALLRRRRVRTSLRLLLPYARLPRQQRPPACASNRPVMARRRRRLAPWRLPYGRPPRAFRSRACPARALRRSVPSPRRRRRWSGCSRQPLRSSVRQRAWPAVLRRPRRRSRLRRRTRRAENQRPSTAPSDEAKTIARPSPAFIQAKLAQAAAAGRAAQAAAGGTAGAAAPRTGLPGTSASASRPAPALPSKVAGARSGAAPGAAPPGAAGASPAFATKPAAKVGPAVRSGLAQPSPKPPVAAPSPQAAPPPAAAPSKSNGSNESDDIDIELDMGGAPMNNGAVEIGDDGLADAEAALEAMQSFRLAEAALQRNDLAGAEKLAQKAVDGDPTQVDYVTLLAWIRALRQRRGRHRRCHRDDDACAHRRPVERARAPLSRQALLADESLPGGARRLQRAARIEPAEPRRAGRSPTAQVEDLSRGRVAQAQRGARRDRPLRHRLRAVLLLHDVAQRRELLRARSGSCGPARATCAISPCARHAGVLGRPNAARKASPISIALPKRIDGAFASARVEELIEHRRRHRHERTDRRRRRLHLIHAQRELALLAGQERRPSGEHLVEDDTCRIQVAAPVERVTEHLLR